MVDPKDALLLDDDLVIGERSVRDQREQHGVVVTDLARDTFAGEHRLELCRVDGEIAEAHTRGRR